MATRKQHMALNPFCFFQNATRVLCALVLFVCQAHHLQVCLVQYEQ